MKKRKINFTVHNLEELVFPETDSKQVLFYDTKVRGLALRLASSGSKTYVYYRRLPKDNESPLKVCEITIGKFDDVRIEQARHRAEQFNALVGEKKDPSQKLKSEITYGELFEQYIENYAKLHTATWENAIYNHRKYFQSFDRKLITQISRSDVRLWVKELAETSGKHTANRSLAALRAVFNWGLRGGVINTESPCIGVDSFKLQPRERFIHPGDEFKKFAKAVNSEPNETMRDFFWMSLYTGARKSRLLEMEWANIDFELMTWHIPKDKNGRSQTLPLTPNAMAILKRRWNDAEKHERWVFPSDRRGRKTGIVGHLNSVKSGWIRILNEAKIPNLRIHDLRRTAASYMAIQGVSSTIIGKALGHRSPQSTAIYARLTQDPVRQALINAQEALTNPKKRRTKQ